MKPNRKKIAIAITLVLSALMLASGSAMAVNIPTVPIGNVGNVADTVVAYNGGAYWDTTTNLGSVNYAYGMGKYEVTAAQYTAFLNAVAATDTYGLYHTQMANLAFSGISRTGSPGSYTYAVDSSTADRPAQFVSYWDATRFANWMSNGQPHLAQGIGSTETGSYTLTPGSIASNSVARNPGATWVIPSEDEWYKAAYFNGSSYWLYPTQSNTLPGNALPDLSGNNANLALNGPYPLPIETIPSPHYTTMVASFANSASYYGTFDQAGNVYEWNEGLTTTSPISGLVGRGLRGGSFGDDAASSAERSLFMGVAPNYSAAVSGFRLAVLAVPEPSTTTLLAVGALVLAWRGRTLSRSAAAGTSAAAV